jgi:hypothetical protein
MKEQGTVWVGNRRNSVLGEPFIRLIFKIIRWFHYWYHGCGSEIRAREAHAEVRTKDLDRYTYRVTWLPEDGCWPLRGAHRSLAGKGLIRRAGFSAGRYADEAPPTPLAEKRYSREFSGIPCPSGACLQCLNRLGAHGLGLRLQGAFLA